MKRILAIVLTFLVYCGVGGAFLSPAQSQNVLTNGGFENGTDSWGWYTNGTGGFSTGTPAYEGSAAGVVSITTTGNNMQVYQTGMTLYANTLYRLSFAARSTGGHDMRVYVHKEESPWTNYGLAETADLSSGWGTYQYEFTTPESFESGGSSTTDSEVRFWFVNYAEAGDTYRIDSVYLCTVSQDTTAPQAPALSVPASGATGVSTNPTLIWNRSSGATSYRVQVSTSSSFSSTVVNQSGITDSSYGVSGLSNSTTYYWRVNATNSAGTSDWSTVRNFTTTTSSPSQNILTNGGFENGTDSWGWYTNGQGSFSTGTPAYTGSAAGVVSITTTGNNMQLYQTGMTLYANTLYRLSFAARATGGHDMRAYVHKEESPWTNYGLAETADLSSGYGTYQYEFTTPESFESGGSSTTDSEVRFWFVNYAEAGDTYRIDSVYLCTVNQDTTPPEPLPELSITPGREQFVDDEPILLGGELSDGTIISYVWFVDDVQVSTSPTLMQYFPLAEGQATKEVEVRLEITDSEDRETEKTVTILVKRRPRSYYYLTDHLGSIRATVRGGERMLIEDFETEDLFGMWTLPQWTYWYGSGFRLYQGRLTHESASASLLLNNSVKELTDGIVAVDVQLNAPDATGSLVIRHMNSYYYGIEVHNDHIDIIKRRPWDLRVMATYTFNPSVSLYETHPLQVTAEAKQLSVYWDNVLVKTWTDYGTGDDAALLSGKVGFWHGGGGSQYGLRWDNVVVTSGVPGQVITAEDYDPWGMVLDGRSYVYGNPDQRYKFTGKERDAESGYDYFGARYYDSRIGRFTSVDRRAEKYPMLSSYHYASNNPLVFVDIHGDSVASFDNATGSFLRFEDDGKTEWSGRTVSYSGKGEMTVHNSFSFNDPSADITGIKNGVITRVVFVSDGLVDAMIARSGVNGDMGFIERYQFAKENSTSGGTMDYAVRGVMIYGDLSKNQFSVAQSTAYNLGDFGNYVWGAAMRTLGIGVGDALMGAQYNNFANGYLRGTDQTSLFDFGPGTYGRPGLLDDWADQRAIYNGFFRKGVFR